LLAVGHKRHQVLFAAFFNGRRDIQAMQAAQLAENHQKQTATCRLFLLGDFNNDYYSEATKAPSPSSKTVWRKSSLLSAIQNW